MGVESFYFEELIENYKLTKGVLLDTDLDEEDWDGISWEEKERKELEKREENALIERQLSREEIDLFIKQYPNSDYTTDLKFKRGLVENQLAAKELYVARYYVSVKKWIPAINRLKVVIKDYEETIFVEEALHRLVEIYYKLGLIGEAEKTAKILGYNYNSSKWLGWALFLYALKTLVFSHVFASELPKCPPDGPYHNCFGKYIWVAGHKKGDKYIGEFRDNKFHGTGTYYFAPNTKFVSSGNVYSGQWKNGAKHGLGTYTWSDGEKYEGQWRGTRLGGVGEGDGVFTWKDGTVYTGQFSRKGPGKNVKHGYGKIVFTCLLYTSPSPRDRG